MQAQLSRHESQILMTLVEKPKFRFSSGNCAQYTNVEKMLGALTYDTSTSLADAAAFYQEQIPNLGWTQEGEVDITESMGFLVYKMDSQNMMILLTAKDNATAVTILLENSQE